MDLVRRHEDALMGRFDAVAKLGFAQVEYWELYLWYNANRIGRNIWRDLQLRFNRDCKCKGDLYIYEYGSGILLIHNDNIKPISEKLGEKGNASDD